MKRRDFIGAAGKSLLLTPLLADRIAGNQMKIESAFRVQIGYPLADPFCMSTPDGYYLLGTLSKGYNPQSEYLFNIFHSSDLKSWTHHGRILKQAGQLLGPGNPAIQGEILPVLHFGLIRRPV